MTLDEVRECFLSKKGAWEDYPFDDVTPVFKVRKKMFGLIGSTEGKLSISLKCDPDLAMDLRDAYEDVIPGYHFNKKHWNTVICEGSLPDDEIVKMVEHSYKLVVRSLPKAERERIGM